MIPTASTVVADRAVTLDGPLPATPSSRRPLRVAVTVLAAVAMGVAALVGSAHKGSPAAGPVTVGMAPSFQGLDVRAAGQTVRFGPSDRASVVTFFAAWCGPCRTELPRLSAAARSHASVDFVGVDVQDVRSEALDLMAASHVGFPVAADPDKAVANAYRLRGMPTTLFVAPGGRVVAEHTGPVSASDLSALLAKLEGTR